MKFTIVGTLGNKEEAEEITVIAKNIIVGNRARELSRQAKMRSTAQEKNQKT